MNKWTTSCQGIHQGDVTVRTALMQALREIRNHPELLDYCFAWLPKDELTAKDYGLQTVDAAKKWFLKTEVPVSLDVRLDQAKLPMITVSMGDSTETAQTLGDIDSEVAELGMDPTTIANLESVAHTESYQIGCYVQGEPEHLLFLYSIVLFALYKYKKSLFEARGMEVVTIGSGTLYRVQQIEADNVFGREIKLTGIVHHYWPADIVPRVTRYEQKLLIGDKTKSPESVDLSGANWIMDADVLQGAIATQPKPVPAPAPGSDSADVADDEATDLATRGNL